MITIDNQKTRLIDANALEEELNRWLDENPLLFEDDEFNYGEISGVKFCIEEIQKTPTIEPDSMRPHGKWMLNAKSFYKDTMSEEIELCVYITAHCSECNGRHPDSYQVYDKTIYPPDNNIYDYVFDQKAEELKSLKEFNNYNYKFANYCPNCGAKMEVKYE